MKLMLEKKMENQNSHLFVDEKCKQWGEIIVVQ